MKYNVRIFTKSDGQLTVTGKGEENFPQRLKEVYQNNKVNYISFSLTKSDGFPVMVRLDKDDVVMMEVSECG